VKVTVIYRCNISLSGDIELSVSELKAIGAENISSLRNLEAPILSKTTISVSKQKSLGLVRDSAPYGAVIENTDWDFVHRLITRSSFIQTIFIETKSDIPSGFNFGSLIRKTSFGFIATTMMALFESTQWISTRKETQISNLELPNNIDLILKILLLETGNDTTKIAAKPITANSSSSFFGHGIHYYKAKFFPRMARSSLNLAIGKDDPSEHHILDNFAGSGTTLFEAMMLGADSTGIDIDPISVLISKAKVEFLKLNHKHLQDVIPVLDRISEGKYKTIPPIEFPDWLIANRKWTTETEKIITQDISMMVELINSVPEQSRQFITVIASDSLTKRLKFRFLGTGSGRFSLSIAKTPVVKTVRKSLKKSIRDIICFDHIRTIIPFSIGETSQFIMDARKLTFPGRPFTGVVTSPPYLPSSSGRETYSKSRIISHLALELVKKNELDGINRSLVGSMDYISRVETPLGESSLETVNWLSNNQTRKEKSAPVKSYFQDIYLSYNRLNDILKPQSKCVLVSGKQSLFYESKTREVLHICHSAKAICEQAILANHKILTTLDVELDKSNMNARPRSLDAFYETLIISSPKL